MNLRKWSKGHTFGMLLGIVTPLLVVPILLLALSYIQDYDFSFLWRKFTLNSPYLVQMITISIIANLIWFYYIINRSKWDHGMGIILGAIALAPYIVYVKFFQCMAQGKKIYVIAGEASGDLHASNLMQAMLYRFLVLLLLLQ